MLVAIIRKRLTLQVSLYTLLQILSVTLCKTMPVQQAFPESDDTSETTMNSNQLGLFTC